MQMQRPIACLPDALLLSGYLDPDALQSLARAWQTLIAAIEPDLVVCDYAPTALLACRERRTAHGLPLRTIVSGTGFANPAPGHPVADWRPQPGADDLIARQEALVLRAVNTVLAHQRKQPLHRFADLFAADATFVTTFPELDLYAAQRERDTPAAPIHCIADAIVPANAAPVAWPQAGTGRIVAYLKPQYPQLQTALRALADCGAAVVVVCPGGDPKLLQSFASARLRVHADVVALAQTIAEADLFVGNGNMNSVAQALLAGKPVLALPILLEQLLIGNRVQALGLGCVVARADDAAQLAAQIGALLRDEACTARAQAFAQRQSGLSSQPALLVRAKCEALLGPAIP
jgi:UDP:flavonoid glycosyltransferase YjiC (YdhE family)